MEQKEIDGKIRETAAWLSGILAASPMMDHGVNWPWKELWQFINKLRELAGLEPVTGPIIKRNMEEHHNWPDENPEGKPEPTSDRQTCKEGHEYIANSHEYPCPLCDRNRLLKLLADIKKCAGEV